MKRIGIVGSEFGREKGGIQNWMYYIELLLRESGFEVARFSWREDNPLRKLSNVFTSSLYILATWKMSLFLFPMLFSRKPFFILVHGNEILNLGKLQKAFVRLMLSRNNIYFIANSHAISDIFEENFEHPVDAILYPFMELPSVRHDRKRPEKNSPIFLTVTRLVKRKNIHNVLKALRKLKQKGLHFRYIIAGDGQERAFLESLCISLGLEKEVLFLGRVSEDKKRKLYLQSDYFLLPSVYDEAEGSIEGYGIVFIEANAYGVPVLSGNTGGMVEAVIDGKTGLQCDGSVKDITEKIEKMIQIDFDRRTLFTHAQKHNYKNQAKFIAWVEKGKVDHA